MKLSIICGTARNSHANKEAKHLFLNLFESIESQNKFHKDVEVIIVDALYEMRDLRKELEDIKQWSFAYKIIKPVNTYWRQQRLWTLNSQFNEGFRHSSGDLLFFCSDGLSLPVNFFEKYFSFIDKGYCPHVIYINTHENKLLMTKSISQITPIIKFKHVRFDFEQVNESLEFFKQNNFFGNKPSEIISIDHRYDYLIQNNMEMCSVFNSWFYTNVSITRSDFIDLNGYDENFDGFKGLCDVELGIRFHRLKNGAANHIISPDLYAYENIYLNVVDETTTNLSKFSGGHYLDPKVARSQPRTFINFQTFFNEWYLHNNIIRANEYDLPDHKHTFVDVGAMTNDLYSTKIGDDPDHIETKEEYDFRIETANYFLNNRTKFDLREYAK